MRCDYCHKENGHECNCFGKPVGQSWYDWMKSCYSVCPFAEKSRHVVIGDWNDTAFLVLPELDLNHLRDLLEAIAPDLYDAGIVAIGLHPDHPFEFRGKFTRRSPQPAIQFTRRPAGDAAREALMQTNYYDDYPEDDMQWGLEHLP